MPHCDKKMLSFFLTTKCNLCCRYCYNANERNEIKTEQSISLEIAFAAIDWYFSRNKSRHIRFYGPGEPTQDFEKMKTITEYAKSHPNGGNRVTVEIQSNGVFTDEIREWIQNNVNILWVSFDGMRDVQNYYRPINPKYLASYNYKSSSEVLEENVKFLVSDKSKNIMVGARVTITDENSILQNDMVDYFYSLGIRHVWTNPLFYSVGKIPVCKDECKKSNFGFDMNVYIDNFIASHYYAKTKGMFWGSFLMVNFDGESEYHCRCCTPQDAPHITPDGYISACDMVLLGEKPYHMSPFVVGKWNPKNKEFDLFHDRIKALNERKSTNISHCKNCSVKFHCGGYCLGECVNETGDLEGLVANRCDAIRKLYAKLGSQETYLYMHP